MSVNVNAQIQRSFFDLTLGESTRQQVEEKMKSMEKQMDSNQHEIKVHNLNYADYDWEDVIFGFDEGILFFVSFLSKAFSQEETDKATQDAASFYELLKNKYKDYCVMDQSGIVAFKDANKTMSFFINKKKGALTDRFTIMYTDGSKVSKMMEKMKGGM